MRICVLFCLLTQMGSVFSHSVLTEPSSDFLSCTNNGCRNNGTCVGEKCACQDGYTGILCQSEILECLSQPCKNNGICNDRIGSFKCTCINGYSGSLCEIEPSTLTTSRPTNCPACQNGTCMNDVWGARCICNDGYTGNDCSTPLIDPDVTNQCSQNYFGQKCEKFCKEFDDCANGHYYCDPRTGNKICRSGWTGNNCTIREIPNYLDKHCPPNLSCKNDGYCFNLSCCCRAGYTGQYCESQQFTCSDKPCPPGCTCHQVHKGHQCYCPSTTTSSTVTTTLSPTTTTQKASASTSTILPITTTITTPATSTASPTTTPTGKTTYLSTISTQNSTVSFSTVTRDVGFCTETKCDINSNCIGATVEGICYCLSDKAFFCPFISPAKPSSTTPPSSTTLSTTIPTTPTSSPTTTPTHATQPSTTTSTTIPTTQATLPTTTPTTQPTITLPTTTMFTTSTTTTPTTPSSTTPSLKETSTTTSPTTTVTIEPTTTKASTSIFTMTPTKSTLFTTTASTTIPTTPKTSTTTSTTESTTAKPTITMFTTTTLTALSSTTTSLETTSTTTSTTTTLSTPVPTTTTTTATETPTQTTRRPTTNHTSKPSTALPTTTQSTTTSTTISTSTSYVTTTSKTPESNVHSVYLNGTVKTSEMTRIPTLLHVAANKSGNGQCEPNITDVQSQQMVSKNMQLVFKITFRASDCFNETNINFLTNLINGLKDKKPVPNVTGPFTPENTDALVSLKEALYHINLNGYIYKDNLKTITNTLIQSWKTGRPEVKDVDVLIFEPEQMIGRYGSRVSKIPYLTTSQGSLITPKVYQPPSTTIVNDVLKSAQYHTPTQFGDSVLYPYTDGVRTRPNEDIQINNVTELLRSSYLNNLKSLNRCSNDCSLYIILSPIEKTSDERIREIVYFPVLNNNLMHNDNPVYVRDFTSCYLNCSSPQRQQYIDVLGHLKLKDRKSVEKAITYDVRGAFSRRAVPDFSITKYNNFLTLNDDSVTRIWYSAVFNDSKVQWPYPNLSGRFEYIQTRLTTRNMTAYIYEVKKLFEINLYGTVHARRTHDVNNASVMAWKIFNKVLNTDELVVRIHTWDNNYFSETGDKATKVKYSVSILNTDSSNTVLQEPSGDVLKNCLPLGISLCDCIARKIREIGVTGQIDLIDKVEVSIVLRQLWMSTNNETDVSIKLQVRNIITGYQTVDGKPALKLEYYVSPSRTDSKYVDEDDLDEPSYETIKVTLHKKFPEITIVETTIKKSVVAKDSASLATWIIVVAVIAALMLVIILVVAAIVYNRRSESRTLKQIPGEMNGYDKEHFSEQPDFDSPNYSLSENDYGDKERKNSYIVNS